MVIMSDTDYADEFSGDEHYHGYDGFRRESDEDTEDASETDLLNYEGEYTEIKEQMYRDKLHSLTEQLKQLENGTHPEFLKKFKKIEQVYQERIIFNEAFLKYENERIENEFSNEKLAAVREFEERKIELKENLIQELEDKKKQIESERQTLELNADALEPKPITTRKLRRRPNDPTPVPEKRRRASPQTLNIQLDESEIQEDIKAIARATNPKYSSSGSSKKGENNEESCVNGRLSDISEEDESDDDEDDHESETESKSDEENESDRNDEDEHEADDSERDSDSSSMDDSSTCSSSEDSNSSAKPEIKCEFVDGKLIYNSECYQRGQQVIVQQPRGGRPKEKRKKRKGHEMLALIESVNSNRILIKIQDINPKPKGTLDSSSIHSQLRISLLDLKNGAYLIRTVHQ